MFKNGDFLIFFFCSKLHESEIEIKDYFYLSRGFFSLANFRISCIDVFFTYFDILSSNFPAIFKGLLKHPAPLMILKNLPLTQLMIARSLTMVSFGRMDLSKYQFIFFPLFFS